MLVTRLPRHHDNWRSAVQHNSINLFGDLPLQRCLLCKERKPIDDYPKTGKRRTRYCSACRNRTEKQCGDCKQTKPMEDFRWNTGWDHIKRKDSVCAKCRNRRAREWHTKPENKKRYHAGRIRREYGLPEGEYENLLASQGGGCAICGITEKATNAADGKARRLDVDHDHVTGEVRGICCSTCNNGLGCFRDDPILIQKAVEYLRKRRKISRGIQNRW